jgi:WbqC-like protein family
VGSETPGVAKRVVILQSNYIPWKGYFDLMRSADEFVILDEVQFTRRDWRNRNLIKTQHGLQWLTIPVTAKGTQKINEIQISEPGWHLTHWKTISRSLCRARYFEQYENELHQAYLAAGDMQLLSQINLSFLTLISRLLGIETRITQSSDYETPAERTTRLLSICQMTHASEYISGPAAKTYLDEELFNQAGISVRWFDYEGYPAYPQLFGEFEHRVTVLDLLSNTGPNALQYLVREPKTESDQST